MYTERAQVDVTRSSHGFMASASPLGMNTPRRTGAVAPPGASLLDRDVTKLVAAQRTPRRGPPPGDDTSRMSNAELERYTQLERRKRHRARVAEGGSGMTVSQENASKDQDDAAVLHLGEHLYDLGALAEFQRANDAALRDADRRLLRLSGSRQRSDFVLEHYQAKKSPRKAMMPSPRKKLELRDASAVVHVAVAQQPEEPSGSIGIASRRQVVGKATPAATTAPPADGPSDVEADEWMQQHRDDAPHMYQRLRELLRAKEYCQTAVEDLFYAASTAFNSVTAADTMRDGPASNLSAADFVFAIDPRLVDFVTADFVREVMDNAAIDVIFLSEEELAEAIGGEGVATWAAAAEEVVQEHARQALQLSSSGVPPRASRRCGTTR
jgi:hypothetical protein